MKQAYRLSEMSNILNKPTWLLSFVIKKYATESVVDFSKNIKGREYKYYNLEKVRKLLEIYNHREYYDDSECVTVHDFLEKKGIGKKNLSIVVNTHLRELKIKPEFMVNRYIPAYKVKDIERALREDWGRFKDFENKKDDGRDLPRVELNSVDHSQFTTVTKFAKKNGVSFAELDLKAKERIQPVAYAIKNSRLILFYKSDELASIVHGMSAIDECIQCGKTETNNDVRGGLCFNCYAHKYCVEHNLTNGLFGNRKPMIYHELRGR